MDQLRGFLAFAHQLHGRIDYAVHAAGVAGYLLNLVDLADEHLLTDHDPVLTNLYGVVHSIREQAKYWYKNGDKNSMSRRRW